MSSTPPSRTLVTFGTPGIATVRQHYKKLAESGEEVEKDAENLLFPKTLLKTLESGKSLQRTTIPYKFVEFVEDATENKLDDFCWFAATNLKYDIQDTVDDYLKNHSNKDDLIERFGQGLTAAIRTFANWHCSCMLWTAEFESHRTQTIKMCTLVLADKDEKVKMHDAVRVCSRFYSFKLSLEAAKGHIAAFPQTKRSTSLSARTEPRKVDACRAYIIFNHVESCFLNTSLDKVMMTVIPEPATFNDIILQAKTLRLEDWDQYIRTPAYTKINDDLTTNEKSNIENIRHLMNIIQLSGRESGELLRIEKRELDASIDAGLDVNAANKLLFNDKLLPAAAPTTPPGSGADSGTDAPFSKVVIEEEPKADDGGDDDGELAAAHDWSAGP